MRIDIDTHTHTHTHKGTGTDTDTVTDTHSCTRTHSRRPKMAHTRGETLDPTREQGLAAHGSGVGDPLAGETFSPSLLSPLSYHQVLRVSAPNVGVRANTFLGYDPLNPPPAWRRGLYVHSWAAYTPEGSRRRMEAAKGEERFVEWSKTHKKQVGTPQFTLPPFPLPLPLPPFSPFSSRLPSPPSPLSPLPLSPYIQTDPTLARRLH